MELVVKASGNSLSVYNGFTLPVEDIKVKREKTISKLPEDHKEAVRLSKMIRHSLVNIKDLKYKSAKIERELLYNNMLIFITTILSTSDVVRISNFKLQFGSKSILHSPQIDMLQS